MQPQISAGIPVVPKSGVLVVDGFGITISVRNGHLHVSDGVGRERRSLVLPKAGTGLERLVLLGHTGYISLESIRWLANLDVALVQIDRDGRVLMASGVSHLDDASLRRAQAVTSGSALGLEIMREILTRKLQGQLKIATALDARPAILREIERAIWDVHDAERLEDLRLAEADGAAAYWSSWGRVRITFSKREESRVPEHWKTFDSRRSLVTKRPRLASNPANALLNYSYGLLEAETRIACLATGLDPAMGILHTDQAARDSLVLDVMEGARPAADGYLLKLINSHTFRRRDFHETETGVCRLVPPLTHHLAEILPLLRREVAPIVERTARALSGKNLPTHLTQDNRRAVHNPRGRAFEEIRIATPLPPPACRSCGQVLGNRGRVLCDECLAEQRSAHLAVLVQTGPAAVARLRAEGRDPLRTPAVRRRIGRGNRARQRAILAWEREHGPAPNPDLFRREIWPQLQGIPLSKLAAATGLSINYCSLIRRGTCVPHAMHWDLFRSVSTD